MANMATTNTTTSTVTSQSMNSTLMTSSGTSFLHTTNATRLMSTAIPNAAPSTQTWMVGLIIAFILSVVVLIAVLIFLYKRRLLPTFFYRSKRKRRSSTSSSRRALDEESMPDGEELESHRPNEKLKKTTEEMFTIEDFEEGREERDGEEYFYDEVFGRSDFEDETTKNSVRQLYTRGSVDSQNGEEEMLDFDFETLGISADEYSLDTMRNVNV